MTYGDIPTLLVYSPEDLGFILIQLVHGEHPFTSLYSVEHGPVFQIQIKTLEVYKLPIVSKSYPQIMIILVSYTHTSNQSLIIVM
jgi:hypothetical protein